MLAHRIDAPGQDVGPAIVGEQGKQSCVVMQPNEHDGIDTAAKQLFGDANLFLQVVVVFREHHRVALVVEHRLHGAGCARIERVAE